ncbi:hypothetical protein ACIRRH_35945 [Kitasatospora sp. NPDC101235]|uniref:hypothetical protein n=1 Tax=Kitasatospora sp. NPDC101235 TaxID=3364101 RepID=UPI00382C5EC2
MTTPPPRHPHPQAAPLRAPANTTRHHPEPTGTATARTPRDDHRTQNDRRARRALPWPCATDRSAA